MNFNKISIFNLYNIKGGAPVRCLIYALVVHVRFCEGRKTKPFTIDEREVKSSSSTRHNNENFNNRR